MGINLRRSIILVISVLTVHIFAGTSVNFSLSMRTGDKEFDMSLNKINTEAQQSLPDYYMSMESSFGVRPYVIDRLLYHHFLSPADAYFVIRVSIITGRPVEEVVTGYKSYKHKGWGEYAKHLGIKPGSKEFHELKNGGVVVLEHWRGGNKKVIYVDKQDNYQDFDRNDDKHEHGRSQGNGQNDNSNNSNGGGKGYGNGHSDKGHGKKK
jgi:hypothetical protein